VGNGAAGFVLCKKKERKKKGEREGEVFRSPKGTLRKGGAFLFDLCTWEKGKKRGIPFRFAEEERVD